MATPINKLLQAVIDLKGSDLHLAVGLPPIIRYNGNLKPLALPVIKPDDTAAYMKAITPDRCQVEVNEKGTTDFGFPFQPPQCSSPLGRFRVSVYKERQVLGIALRLIPSKLLTFEEIGLPPGIKNLLEKPRGLVLITGPTGCGKTTTLATMIDFINTESDKHIITIEDPIEYYHGHKKSIITQREVGVDVTGFGEGLRRALRQDPDVILVGELRDLETIETAIRAAETGHLVFATLHTTGAAKTIDRIIDVFPPDQQEQIRSQLSTSLVAVISQQLLPTADGKSRIAAFEIMMMKDSIANLIRKKETFKIDSEIQTGRAEGMILLDDHLCQLHLSGKISFNDMMKCTSRPELLEKRVRAMTAAKRQ